MSFNLYSIFATLALNVFPANIMDDAQNTKTETLQRNEFGTVPKYDEKNEAKK